MARPFASLSMTCLRIVVILSGAKGLFVYIMNESRIVCDVTTPP